MPQVATSSTAAKIPTIRKETFVRIQNLHASQNAYYGWGAVGTDVSSSKSLRLGPGLSVDINLATKPVGKDLWVVANGSDTPTVAYDVF